MAFSPSLCRQITSLYRGRQGPPAVRTAITHRGNGTVTCVAVTAANAVTASHYKARHWALHPCCEVTRRACVRACACVCVCARARAHSCTVSTVRSKDLKVFTASKDNYEGFHDQSKDMKVFSARSKDLKLSTVRSRDLKVSTTKARI